MGDSDIGNQAWGVGFYRQTYILNTLALAWHFDMKDDVLQGRNDLHVSKSNLGSELLVTNSKITAGYSFIGKNSILWWQSRPAQ